MRIAFISDIHFGKDSCTKDFTVPGETSREQTCSSAEFESGLVQLFRDNAVSYLFIGGDLTSVGSPQEFYYCENKIIEIAKKAEIPQENIICAFGNHDIDWKIVKIVESIDFKEESVKEIAIKKYQMVAAHGPAGILQHIQQPQEKGPLPFSGVFEREFICIVLNSSCYCSPFQHNKHGQLSLDQLSWFESILKKYEDDTRTKIVLLHHHPIQYPYPITGEDPSLLEEGSELVALAGKYGVNIILHGHRHHPRVKTVFENGWKHPISFICAGSVSVNASQRSFGSIPNMAHIIDLKDAPTSVALSNFEYSFNKGWIELRDNREETPIDAHMKLGQTVTPEEAKECVLTLPRKDGDITIISYNDLPDLLKFCTYNEINCYVRESLSGSFDICGSFPENVSLSKKEDV